MSFELYSSKDFAIDYEDYRKDYLLAVIMTYLSTSLVNFLEGILLSDQHISLGTECYYHASTALIIFI